jgi:rhodanese-related sulfurtransferase
MSQLALIFGGTAVVALWAWTRFGGGNRMSSTVIKEKIAQGALVVDVRSPGEFRGGAYPGARNIPLPELAQHLAELPTEKEIIVYCASGVRSASAAAALKNAGYAVINGGGLSQMPR